MLDTVLDRLKDIKGYMGSAVCDYKGEVLVSDIADFDMDEDEYQIIMGTFNDIFRDAHKASDSLELGRTEEMSIETANSTIITVCSGVESRAHIHLYAIFTKEGNANLGKLTLKKIVPVVLDALTA